MPSRKEILSRLWSEIEKGRPIIISSAGNGFFASMMDKAGIDIIGVYNSGYGRQLGIGSLSGLLPIFDTNRLIVEMGFEILPRVKNAFVIAGVCAQDPRTLWRQYLRDLIEMGFSGIMNFPTVGLIDKNSLFRINLEESGFGYDKEVEVIKLAHEMDIFTIAYCFTPDEVEMMAKAGADVIAVHVGLTTGGLIGAKTTISIEEAIRRTNELISVAYKVRPEGDFIPITHGGPMGDPESVEKVLKETDAVGFVSGSAIERTPVEPFLIEVCKKFKNIKMRGPRVKPKI
ncbi:MAG: phosphoenolpyruvate hydrolase family protein [Candidatus Bathyarchaeia archaeon]